MAYTSRNGRKPIEAAGKTSHSVIIRHPLVQGFLSSCIIPREPDSEIINTHTFLVEPPTINNIRLIIAIDGGFTEVSVQDKYPSSSYTFYNFGGLMFQIEDLQALHDKAFIDPEDMAKLRNIQRFPFVLPTKNLRLNNCATLTESVRWALFDFFCRTHDGEKPLITALRWLIFEEYNYSINDRVWLLASCPVCKAAHIAIHPKDGNSFPCPHCQNIIYLTDVFRLHEVVDDELGAGGILGYLTGVLEQMLLVHLIKTVLEIKSSMLQEIFFVRDGPLAFFGQTANIHKPMRKLMSFLAKGEPVGQSKLCLVGVEKGGVFAEHAAVIGDAIPAGHALILNNDYIYKYITPGSIGTRDPFGSTSYYGSKVIYKAEDRNIYILTIPTVEAQLNPTEQDLLNFRLILHNVAQLKCHMYENALVPIALVNKLVSLSDHPSKKLLSVFAKTQTKK